MRALRKLAVKLLRLVAPIECKGFPVPRQAVAMKSGDAAYGLSPGA